MYCASSINRAILPCGCHTLLSIFLLSISYTIFDVLHGYRIWSRTHFMGTGWFWYLRPFFDSPSIEATVPSSQAISGLNTPLADIALSSQGSTAFFHLYQHLCYKSEEVDLVEAISFAETNLRQEMKLLSYLTILLRRYNRSQNGFNTPYHAMDIPLNYRDHSHSESRRLCSRHLVKLSPNQHLPHLVCVSLMSVYLKKQWRNFDALLVESI